MKRPRVLIMVSGGVADYIVDGDVEVELVDFDNEPDAPTPRGFEDLMPSGS